MAAAEALVADADTLPDPILGLEYGNMPLTTPWPGEHPMSGVQLRVSQTFPGPGKRSARVAEARGRVDAARARLPSLQNRLAGSVVTAWHRLAGVRRERVVTAAHIQLVDQLIEVVQVSYEVGRAAQHELLQLQTLRERLSDDLLDFEQRERAFVARLNAILHRAPDTPVPTPEHPTPLTIDPLDDLRAAVDDHPTLEALEAAAQAESRGAERFEAEGSPDYTLTAGYRVRRAVEPADEGEDFVSVGVALPLTWFWEDARWGARAAASRARGEALVAQRAAQRETLRGEVAAAHAMATRAAQKAETYESELVALAHRALDSTFAAYRVGRAGFGQLYQAEVALLELERGAIRARVEAAVAATRLVTLTGRWLSEDRR